MATIVLLAIGLVLLVAVAAIALLGWWLSRSWTVVAEDDEGVAGDAETFWARLRRLFGPGPPRLTYRRDRRGRFRRHRR